PPSPTRSTGRRARRWRRRGSTSRGLARDEPELRRVVLERLPPEATVLGFELEPGDVGKAFPFGLRAPPEGELGAVVALDVDPVVRGCVAQRVHDAALVLRRPVETRGDV